MNKRTFMLVINRYKNIKLINLITLIKKFAILNIITKIKILRSKSIQSTKHMK